MRVFFGELGDDYGFNNNRATAFFELQGEQSASLNVRLRSLSFKAMEGDSLIGFVACDPDGELTNLAVDPSRRRSGLGRRLVERVLATSPTRVRLEVDSDNEAAVALYRSCGFAVSDYREGTRYKVDWWRGRVTERGVNKEGVNNAASSFSSLLARLATAARIEPVYLTVGLGVLLYTYLNKASKALTMLSFDSPEADAAAARTLSVLAFILLQRLGGLKFADWLRLSSGDSTAAAARDGDPSSDARDPLGPILALPSPIAGAVCALLFALPVAVLDTAGVAHLIPQFGTGFPSGERALLSLLIAPLSEEIFFRAWLLSAFQRAGASDSAALIASAGLYGLYVVPLSTVLAGTTGGDGPALLLLYEALGAYLAYLFQRSGGSLPLVASAHCSFNLAVAALAAAA